MGSYIDGPGSDLPSVTSLPSLKRRQSRPAFQRVLSEVERLRLTPPGGANGKSLSERIRGRYHGYGRWIVRKAKSITTRLKMAEVPDKTEVIEQGRYMCQEYVFNRLKKQNLLQYAGKMYPLLQSVQKQTDISSEVQLLGHELEKSYPDLYSSICRQLHFTVKSEASVKQTLSAIADEMYKPPNTLTWAKIIALYSLCGAMTADCVQQGHADFISAVLNSFESIFTKYLAAWVVKQGGWHDLIRTFRTSKETPMLWFLSITGAVVGFAVTLLATSHYSLGFNTS